MRSSAWPRARRRAVGEDLVGHDYADSFEVDVPADDPLTPEQFARLALEQAPWVVRLGIRIAHVWLLRLRLAPDGAPGHVFGWRVAESDEQVLRLEAASPLLGQGVILGRRPQPDRATITTILTYGSPLARAVWAVVGPVHRRAAPYLIERAARARMRASS